MPLHHRESQTARRSSRVCCPFTTHIQVSECLNAQSSHLVTQHVVSEYTLITSRVALHTGVHKYVIIASRNTRSTRTRKYSPRSRASAHRSPFLSHMLYCIPYKVREAASERAYFILLVHILCISHAELRKLLKLLLLACTLAHLHTRHAPRSTTPHLRTAPFLSHML